MCGWTKGIRMVHDTGNSIVEHVAGVDDFEVAATGQWWRVGRRRGSRCDRARGPSLRASNNDKRKQNPAEAPEEAKAGF
jgi:hypothetical protein